MASLYIGIGALAIAGYFMVPRATALQGAFQPALTSIAAATLLFSSSKNSPRHSFVILGAGMAVYAVATFFWFPFPIVSGIVLPYPSWVDVAFLVAYLTLAAGLISFARDSRRPGDNNFIDVAIFTAGAGTLVWTFLLEPQINMSHSLSVVIVSLAYPVVDLIMLGALGMILSRNPQDPRARLLVAGAVGQLFSDFAYTHATIEGTYRFGAWTDIGWLIMWVAVGAAALVPPPADKARGEQHGQTAARWRVAVLLVALFTLPVTRMLDNLAAGRFPAIPAITVVLYVLIVLRIKGLFAQVESERHRFRSLADSIPDAVIAASREGRISYANQVAKEMFGASVSPGRNVFALIEPEDRKVLQGAVDGTLLPKGEAAELTAIDRNDDRFSAEISLGEEALGSENGFTLVLRDVTKRLEAYRSLQQSEAMKTAVLGGLTEGVLVTDSSQRIVSMTVRLEELSGWVEEEVKGRFAHEVFPTFNAHGEQIPPEESPAARAIKTGKDSRTVGYDVYLKTKPGNLVPVSVSASPLLDESGLAEGSVIMVRDVSYEKEVDQMKSSLVSTVSHELRTPLTMITGFSELLLGNNMSQEQSREALSQIHGSSQRLGRLIEDLLSVSRIESGKLIARISEADAGQEIQQVVANFGSEADRLFVDVEPDLPPIRCDPDMLVQVLTNLISNAIKYSPATSPVKVEARRVGADVTISVRDKGIGLSKDQIAELFQKFGRIDRPEVAEVGGTGLGLFITKNLLEMQGGRLTVHSELDEGSTFSFSLPSAKAASQIPTKERVNG